MPAESELAPMTTSDMGAESNSGLISAEMVVDMDIDTEPSRPRTSEATVAVTSPMDSGLTPKKWWIFCTREGAQTSILAFRI